MNALRSTGVVTTVATGADARMMRNAIAQRDAFAIHKVRVVDVHPDRRPREPLGKQKERMRQRCRRFSVGPAALDQLESAVTAASPDTALVMLHLIDLCIADTGFFLVIVDDSEQACLPPSFVDAARTIFDRELLADASLDVGLSVQLERPTPDRLERSVDHDLLRATLDDDDAAIGAWRAWRARASLDHTLGIAEIAPMLSENLTRLGVDDVDMGRIKGIRRRAWYVNELLVRNTTTMLADLSQSGIVPVLLGDVPAAARAAETRSVRPVRSVDVCVQPDEVTRAAAIVARHGWTGNGRPITPRHIDQRTWQRFRIDPGRALFLHWRPLPQGCSRLVAPETDEAFGRVALNGTEMATLSPTAQLLRCWARTGDPFPGHQLRTLCDTADILERCSGKVDWARLWTECARLDLVEYGEMYLRELPVGIGDAGLRELPTRSPH